MDERKEVEKGMEKEEEKGIEIEVEVEKEMEMIDDSPIEEDLGDIINSAKKEISQSQYGQDREVDKITKGVKGGIFVEVGAGDGIKKSNTYLLENHEWTGLCIEANSEIIDELKRNRKCKVIECAIGHKNEKSVDFLIPTSEELKPWAGLMETYDPTRLKSVEKEGYKLTRVEMRTLDDILKEQGLTTIDYLSVFTEGGDFNVFEGLSLDKFKVNIISVHMGPGTPKKEKIFEKINFNGFKFHSRQQNSMIYINSSCNWSWSIGKIKYKKGTIS